MGGIGSGRKSGYRLKETEKKHEAIRAYKLEGHSNKEVAERFGISCDWAKEICRGVARQDLKTRFKKKELEDVKTIIKTSNPDLEYVGGYKNADSKIEIRCTKCGNTFVRSFTTIRHSKNRHGNQKKTRCDYCYTKQLELRVESQKKSHKKLAPDEKERRKAERHLIVIQARAKREAEKQNEKLHECPECGQLTTRRKYCSEECCRKACKGKPSPEAIRRHNAVHDANRRALIKEQIVDKDITLKELFKRDAGICWICGMMCDWSDFTRKNGYFVAGNLYPSIDHVVELSNGGEHSWENVKLAHRICNVKRYYAPISRAI